MDCKLSVCIVAKDEEVMIEDALKSVKFADEILVIDNGSKDKTVSIARKYGARVISYPKGKTFSEVRNKGLKESKGRWIFYLDADERVTPELKDEIIDIVKEDIGSYPAYAIPRRNIILGKEMKYGGWWPDYVKRLFFKKALKKWSGDLHEEPEFEGKIAHTRHPMIHIKHESFSQMIDKTNKWSEIEAKLMFDAKHPPMTIPRFLSAMWREFYLRVVKNRAFRDGPEGLMFAVYQVYSRFISYAKLWEMQVNAGIVK